jgi:hypothetical protein
MREPSRRQVRPLGVWLAVAAPLALAAFFVPQAIATHAQQWTGSGKVTFPLRAHLLHAKTVKVQGIRLAAGECNYSGTAVVHPGETAVQQDEVAEDPATCTMTLVQGTPSAAAVAQPDPAGTSTKSGQASATGTAGQTGSRVLLRAAAIHSAGYSKTRFEDPVGIDVNSVKNTVNWYWNGSSVSNGTCSYAYGWLSGDGWGLKENNFFCRYDGSPTQVHSSSYVHYKNGIFCIGFDTHTYYDRNNAYGRRNGDLVGAWNTRKSGPCSGLLSVHNQTVRTLN